MQRQSVTTLLYHKPEAMPACCGGHMSTDYFPLALTSMKLLLNPYIAVMNLGISCSNGPCKAISFPVSVLPADPHEVHQTF